MVGCVTVTVLTPADITATDIMATPSGDPCIEGICTVDVEVTWTNNGEATGTIEPNITIDGVPATPLPTANVEGYGGTLTRTFTVTGLGTGSYEICPDPN